MLATTSSVQSNTCARAYECSNGDACANPTVPAGWMFGTPNLWDQQTLPSMGIRRDSGSDPVTVHVVRREKVEQDCNGDGVLYADPSAGAQEQLALDLTDYVWDPDNGETQSGTVEKSLSPTCVSSGTSFTRYLDGQVWACFVQKPNPNNTDDWVECDSRSKIAVPVGSWTANGSKVLDNGNSSDDHPWFDFIDGPSRVLAHRRLNQVGPWEVLVRFPDDPADPTVSFPATLATKVDYPSIEAGPGLARMVWSNGEGAGSSIEFSKCDPVDDCKTAAGWDPANTFFSGDSMAHPQRLKDGDREILLFQAEVGGPAGDRSRVFVAQRCIGSGLGWEGPDLVRTPTDTTYYQHIAFARPNLALNRDEQLVHITFVETNTNDANTMTDGTVFWYHAPYTPCP